MAPFRAMFVGAFWHPMRNSVESKVSKASQKTPWAAPNKELQVSGWNPGSARTTLGQVAGGKQALQFHAKIDLAVGPSRSRLDG